MKTAFLFPGQGAQYQGMGRDVIERVAQAAAIYERAGEVLGFDIRRTCVEGPAEALNTTALSQPAIFVTSVALLEALQAHPATRELKPDVTAGLSLGEYTALYAAGVVSFEDALRLVQKRGQAMQMAAEQTDGAMISVLGLEPEQVRTLCQEAAEGDLLEPANFNCPGQIVISGTKASCARAQEMASRFGAIKAIRLDVAGAFHTAMMSGAADALATALAECRFSDPSAIKVVSNITARYYDQADDIRIGLTKQLTAPILWQSCMERLLAAGVEQFYEIGPGRVLTGLMRRIHRKTKVVNISSLEGLESVQAMHSPSAG